MTSDASPLTDAVGEELRSARQRAQLSLRDAAEQVGISRGYLSRAENGAVVPSWDMLVRIAAAYRRVPRLRLLPVVDDLEARARAMVTQSPLQRLSGHEQMPEDALHRLVVGGMAFVVTGAVAAVLQGLPMAIDEMTVLVRNDDENLAALVTVLMAAHTLYRELAADEMRRACDRPWLVGWCEIMFELVEELPDAVELAVGHLSVPVVPLTMLVAGDRDVADVFQAVQTVLAG